MAHPRPATPTDADAGPCNSQRRSSDPANDHDVTHPAATETALGTASRGPEPLKSTHHDAGEVSVVYCRSPLINIKRRSLRVSPLLCVPLCVGHTGDA